MSTLYILQILQLIRAHPDRNDLVVRLAFCLGNFAAADDQCRHVDHDIFVQG